MQYAPATSNLVSYVDSIQPNKSFAMEYFTLDIQQREKLFRTSKIKRKARKVYNPEAFNMKILF